MVFSPLIPPKPPWYAVATPAPAPFPTVPHRNTLLASATDNTPATENQNNTSNNINNDCPNDDDDNDDCFPCQATQPVSQQATPQEQQWYLFFLPAITHTSTQAPRKRTTKRTLTKQSVQRRFENNHPDNDNNNNNDVDCFPRQDKQPVLPQDISPTATTANNPSFP